MITIPIQYIIAFLVGLTLGCGFGSLSTYIDKVRGIRVISKAQYVKHFLLFGCLYLIILGVVLFLRYSPVVILIVSTMGATEFTLLYYYKRGLH